MKTFKQLTESLLKESSLPGKLDYDSHSWDSDRAPAAPHNKNLKLIKDRQKVHKAGFSDPVHGEKHKELHDLLNTAKHATMDHLDALNRSGAFGVHDYKGDYAISKLRDYNNALRK